MATGNLISYKRGRADKGTIQYFLSEGIHEIYWFSN